MMPFRSILPTMLEQGGYFQHFGIAPRNDIFRVERLPHSKVTPQFDAYSCEMFCLTFINCIIYGLAIPGKITQNKILELRQNTALQIFLNITDPTTLTDQFEKMKQVHIIFDVFFITHSVVLFFYYYCLLRMLLWQTFVYDGIHDGS